MYSLRFRLVVNLDWLVIMLLLVVVVDVDVLAVTFSEVFEDFLASGLNAPV